MASKRRAVRPKASSWDKLSARTPEETIANRDVFEDQQLDRGQRKTKRSKRPSMILGGVVGFFVALLVWMIFSMGQSAISAVMTGASNVSGSGEVGSYTMESQDVDDNGDVYTCYQPVDENGTVVKGSDCYKDEDKVPEPAWHKKAVKESKKDAKDDSDQAGVLNLGDAIVDPSLIKIFVSLGSGLLLWVIITSWMSRQVDKHNMEADDSDINEHRNDQHIALPQEIQQNYDFFPDVGAHSDVLVSSMLSHMMFRKKGLQNVTMLQRADKDIEEDGETVYYEGEIITEEVPRRAEKDTYDEDGNLLYKAGEVMKDEDGEPLTEFAPVSSSLPIIDEDFGQDLFTASGMPQDKNLRKTYDTTVIPYNPGGKNRDKLGAGKKSPKEGEIRTVAELIKKDWEFPSYEVQRPAGAYVVDTAPVNTMVLAITRAGKGQTYIEPVLDMWSREKEPQNMVVNDPKGELLVKNYIPFVTRGYEPVQFNLINPLKTDIYNPLGLAIEAAREGDSTKAETYVNNIGDVFFPLDGGDDPVWPNAANNAFRRAAHGLIDFYLEEEREMRAEAAATGKDPGTLERELDEMWGRVTMYNVYQFFVQLTAKKVKNPLKEFEAEVKKGDEGEFASLDDEELNQKKADAEFRTDLLWNNKDEEDMLSLFFNATQALPRNSIRTIVGNAHNALVSMAGAEKMLASVYGISITALSFFADNTISALTSGRPSQNVDLSGMSFPRRMGIRLADDFITKHHLLGMQAVWTAYGDSGFTQELGKDFRHEDIVSREGWARYYFKGKFPEDTAWIKLELVNSQTKMLVKTFYFQFTKNYQLSLNGRHYVVEPVTGKKMIKDGVLRELTPTTEHDDDGNEVTRYRLRGTTYKREVVVPEAFGWNIDWNVKQIDAPAITQTNVRYTESPKAVFLVTPPHLMSYAKLILILIKQLVDLNFDKSYMTKSNQKPLYKTRFMLDELGNLQSEGHGISGFQTMLSIGLGQEQQFTLILQTLQQLRDVYGESVDKIVQGNVSNIVFLKSTDDSMLETLEKMSGKTHRTYANSKTITKNMDKMIGGTNEGSLSVTRSTEEEPLITYNDMAFLTERNSIVFRAGDAPIWNRNETILPMSFKLFDKKIVHPGHDYSLQTIPTLSSVMEFDVRLNQPNFRDMVEKRMKQAQRAGEAAERYKDAKGYKDIDIERLQGDDQYAEDVMDLISRLMAADRGAEDTEAISHIDPEEYTGSSFGNDDAFIENTEVAEQTAKREARAAEMAQKIYAEGTISRDMLVTMVPSGEDGEEDKPVAQIKRLDKEITEAYRSARPELERDTDHFLVGGDGSLRSADGSKTYIEMTHSEEYGKAAQRLNDAVEDAHSRTFSDEDVTEENVQKLSTMKITSSFYLFLGSLPTWQDLGDGEFDRVMAREMRNSEDETIL